MKTENRAFGVFLGKDVQEYRITNSQGYTLAAINYGATLTDFIAPDKNGKIASIMLGQEDVCGYMGQSWYLGAAIGPFGNRIANARFTLNGKEIKLTSNNNGTNNLHSSPHGFNALFWEGEFFTEGDATGVRFSRTCVDGESAFPGNRKVSISYSLNESNELNIVYRMESDQDTPANMTNHAYWNLNGTLESTENHRLTILGNHYLPVDDKQIPTGELKPVKGTPMDFTEGKLIGQDIDADPVGFDHNWCIDGEGFRQVAKVEEDKSGRVMEVFSDLPGLQFFAAKPLSNVPVRGGVAQACSGFCLETQHYPDCVNQPEFPSCIIKAGEVFESRTMHRFSVK